MIKGNLEKWIALDSCENLLFFSQLVNELLFDYSIPSNRVATLNSHFLCYDALNAIDGIENKGVPEGNLKPIAEELYAALAVDPVFKSTDANTPLDYFVKYENNKYRISSKISELNYNEMKQAVKSIDILFFSNFNYYEKLKARIKEIIIQNDKSLQPELFRLVKSLLTEIINIGYTTNYIYFIMNKYFWNPYENIANPEYISVFFDSFTMKKEEYDVIFVFDKKKIYRFAKFIEDIELIDSFEPRSNSHMESTFFNIKDNQTFILITKSAYDPFGAADKARKMLSINISVYKLYNHEYRYNMNTVRCGVYHNKVFYRVPSPKSAVTHTRMPSDKEIENGMHNVSISLNTALKKKNFDSYFAILKAIEFHSHALDSVSKENQLLDFWAIFESVLNISNKHTSDRIQQISAYLIPILKRKYIYSLFKQLALDIKKYSENEYTKIVGDIDEEKIIVQKICEFTLLPEFKTKRDDFLSICSDYPLMKERIIYYSEKLNSYGNIYSFVEKHAERVRWQIMRIYRNRNLIIHNGETMPYLNLLIENLHSYIDEFLEYIVKNISEGHTIDSMCQKLYIKECKWSKFNKKKGEINSETIIEILSY